MVIDNLSTPPRKVISQPVTGTNAKEEVSFFPLNTYKVQKQLHNKNISEAAFVKLDVSSAEWHSFKC